MPPQRDPLSVRYDQAAGEIIFRAAGASRYGRGITAWIASPRAEFRQRDKGGRTAHERAFTRSAYYLMKGGRPVHRGNVYTGDPPAWSLKLTWGEDTQRRASSHGRLARPVTVRLYPRGEARVPRGESWRDNPSLRSGAGEVSRFPS